MGRYVSNAGVPASRVAQPVSEETTDDFGQRIAGHARKLFDTELGVRFGKGASDLNRLSDALRGAGTRLEGSVVGPYFERAAGQLDELAQVMQRANSRDIIDGAERLARQRPLLFLGSAILLGIGAGRFLKSSSSGLPQLPSGDRERSPRRPARNRNREASQTRGTSHE